MENFFKITSADELNKIFENASDKLIILMFYTKHNGECRRALSAFEKSALNHTISYFCVIDTDKFQGESRFVSNLNNMPKFECYYMGNSLGSYPTSNEKEIEQIVRSGEQYVMTQNSTKNSGMGQNNMINSMGMMGTMQPNPMQIQQQILNQAQMTNPAQFQYLMQNPMVLQQMVQRQMQLMQLHQQQMMQPQMMQPQTMQPQMMQPQTMQPQMMQPQMITMPQNSNINSSLNPMAIPQQNNTNMIPTLQQMQQMFQIFQMMQQMGALNMSSVPAPTLNTNDIIVNTDINKKIEHDNIIILPNGDKVIPLAEGKYGLIKKSS
jgi:hypothetical protein